MYRPHFVSIKSTLTCSDLCTMRFKACVVLRTRVQYTSEVHFICTPPNICPLKQNEQNLNFDLVKLNKVLLSNITPISALNFITVFSISAQNLHHYRPKGQIFQLNYPLSLSHMIKISGKTLVILVNAKYFCNFDDRLRYRNVNFRK